MTLSPRALVDLILLGPAGDRRQLQDSPILGDVWLKFATHPHERLDLLITPYRDFTAGPVAKVLTRELREKERIQSGTEKPLVAYLQGIVAARLSFRELLEVVVPRTCWWWDRDLQHHLSDSNTGAMARLRQHVGEIVRWVAAETEAEKEKAAHAFSALRPLDRYIALAAVILWAGAQSDSSDLKRRGLEALEQKPSEDEIVEVMQGVVDRIIKDRVADEERRMIWQISVNRRALPALEKSVPAVKGDAASSLFKVNCSQINWAVIDSGIDGSHPALCEEGEEKVGSQPPTCRVVEAYDFQNIRKIVSLDNEFIDDMPERLEELRHGREDSLSAKEAKNYLKQLAKDAGNDRPIHWEIVKKFIQIDPVKNSPGNSHGTHVAGIIGAKGAGREAGGMCPDIRLHDFRVLGQTIEDTEFAIIAALQFIRYLNERSGFIKIHGANLSLSIPHDVRNFACGRTPICNECERLVESGVVVVAAAGNLGYQSFETKDGGFDSYAAFSITDPGNADGVITVGSTHRFWPHTYGVSFFSSRGPTGDGRLKPDIVAPGERIRSCMVGNDWGELDGTSMATPHVSGAAAMLLARYSELVGHPRKIKRILCESATDLGRERTFQGHGMLDVLRAFQKI